MKNKKGFALVELLAVIVILALIMGIAVVSIGSVLSSSRNKVMFENAQSVISGVKKQFAINNEAPEGNAYGFNSSLLESGGITSPLGGNFLYGTPTANVITTGLWKLASVPTTCTASTESYIKVDANGVYTICLTAGAGNKYITGTEAEMSAQDASVSIK